MRRADLTRVGAAVAIGMLLVCWVLLTPPGAGPDEPSHFVRAGALANGDFDEFLAVRNDGALVAHQLPPEYALPEPGCYAFQPAVAVDCAVGSQAVPQAPGGDVTLLTKADDYPVWGHAVAALGTALPGNGGIWTARLATALVVGVLVVASVRTATQHSLLAAAGALVAITPMTWSTFAQVNPSALATAGALALWTTLLARRPGWLMAAGWAALALPRRDGLTWACLIVAVAVIACGRGVLAEVWRDRRRFAGPLVAVGLSTAVMLLWAVTNFSRVARLGALAPLAVVAAWLVRAGWDRLAGRPRGRAVLVVGSLAVTAVGVAATFVVRPGGWQGELARKIVGETRRHLTQAIGVLGWLDTPLPRWSVVAWTLLVVLLALLAVRVHAWRAIVLAGAVLGLAIVTSWVFELQSGSVDGTYWQGRYSLPLLVGVPLALTLHRRAPRGDGPARLASGLAGAALLLVNVAAWAAARRWTVGTDGTHLPWRWSAELLPVHAFPLLILHAAASGGLAAVVWAQRGQAQRFVPPSSK